MTKSKLMKIATIVSSSLILIGVSLSIYLTVALNNVKIIKVDMSSGETQSVEFEDLCLIPGKESEYILSLKRDVKEKYDAKLVFNETAPGELKNFARVRIELNGDTVCDDSLSSLLEGNEITLSIDPKKASDKQLKVIYYLPAEIGNEAENTKAEFELLISVSNQ